MAPSNPTQHRRWMQLPLRDLLWLVTVIAISLGWWAERLKRVEAEWYWQANSSRLHSVVWQLQQHGFVFESVPETNDEEVKIRLTRPELLNRPDDYLTIETPAAEHDSSEKKQTPVSN